jgi:hypothetical protein
LLVSHGSLDSAAPIGAIVRHSTPIAARSPAAENHPRNLWKTL